MRWTLLLMLLLSSCATQRQAEKYFDKNPDKLAEYVDKNEAYTQTYGGAYAAKHFPPRFYPPALYPKQTIVPDRLTLIPSQERQTAAALAPGKSALTYQSYKPTRIVETVYLQDTVTVDSLYRELEIETLANQAIRKRLKTTEAERDYWQVQNEKKFWTLIAMAVFAFLYILFKILASRVRET